MIEKVTHQLIGKEKFQLSTGLILDLSLDWASQKKELGKNLSHTGSSFGRGFPQMILHPDYHYPQDYDLIEKNPDDVKYYQLDYEYDLSKVRTIKMYNEFSCIVTLWERHGVWSWLR